MQLPPNQCLDCGTMYEDDPELGPRIFCTVAGCEGVLRGPAGDPFAPIGGDLPFLDFPCVTDGCWEVAPGAELRCEACQVTEHEKTPLNQAPE